MTHNKQNPKADGGCWTSKSDLSSESKCDQNHILIFIIWSHLKLELTWAFVQQTGLWGFWGRFVEQRLMLSSIFTCDQIYQNERYDLVSLRCVTYVRLGCSTNPPLVCWIKSSCLASALGVTKFTIIRKIIMVTNVVIAAAKFEENYSSHYILYYKCDHNHHSDI